MAIWTKVFHQGTVVCGVLAETGRVTAVGVSCFSFHSRIQQKERGGSWSSSNPDTNGTEESVPILERCPCFRGWELHARAVLGERKGVLISEVFYIKFDLHSLKCLKFFLKIVFISKHLCVLVIPKNPHGNFVWWLNSKDSDTHFECLQYARVKVWVQSLTYTVCSFKRSWWDAV